MLHLLSPAEAVERTREKAAHAEITILRNPQRDMVGLNYDLDDVCDFLETVGLDDVTQHMEDQYNDRRLVLVFENIRFGEFDLYVKVSVHEDAKEDVTVLSFKESGSPR